MSAPTPCPDPEQLGELLAGRLPEEEQATLAGHLDTCENCRKTLEGMAGGDELVPGQGGSPDAPRADQETALQDVMAQLKADGRKERSQADDAVDDTLSLDFLEPSDNPDHLGRFGPYEVTEVIGRGGMGVVLKAFDPRLHRFVAVKVLAPQLASHATARRRFEREAQAAAAVSHDHVITIHAVEEAAELPYLVMEYVSGVSLQERIDRGGPLYLKEILRIGAQVASGLAAAHAHGVIHRDIKPANILLENGVERVKITDFGLARAVDDVTMTQTGVVAGTPQYMSPEQARGDPVDHRGDLFSLGSVLYVMCTGRPPFRAETTMGVIRRVCEEQPRLVREVDQELPEWLAEIIRKLMAKDPDERFQSAAEVADLLGQHLAHLQQPSVVPRPPRLPRRPRESAGRSIKQPRLGRWLVAIVLLLVCALGMTEVTGVTKVSEFVATVLRVRTPQGTLVVEVEDPQVTVDVEGDGETITLSGLGPHEIRLRPGTHQLRKTKDGVSVGTEWVTVTRGGKQVVKIGFDAASAQPEAIGPTAPSFGEITHEVRRFEGGHAAAITCVAVSADGHRLLSGSVDTTLRLWDIETGEEIRPLLGHTKVVHCVGLSADDRYALSSGEDKAVRLWDLETGEQIRSFEGHRARVVGVAFSPDGRLAVSGSADYGPKGDVILRLWDVESGRQLRSLPGHNHIVQGVAFSPDGHQVLAACAGVPGPKRIGLWDTETGQLVRYFSERVGVTSVAFSPDGRRVISGNSGFVYKYDRWVLDPQRCLLRLWDVETGREIRQFKGHSGPVNSVAFAPDGRYVLSGSGGRHGGDGVFVETDDNTVRLWDAETGRELCRFNPGQRVASVAFTPDGRFIVSGGGDGPPDLRLWELPEPLRRTAAPQTSAKGALAVPEILNEVRRFEGSHASAITCIAISTDGRRLLSGSNDATVRLWDVETAEEIRPFLGHTEAVYCVAYSPDGRYALSGGRDRSMRLWDVEMGEEIRRFEAEDGWVRAVAFSPDGQLAVSGRTDYRGGSDGSVRLWDVETGRLIREFDGITQAIHGVAFSSDGRQVVAAGEYKLVGLWHVETGRQIRRFFRPITHVSSVAISPDGRRVVSGQFAMTRKDDAWLDPENSAACLWDVHTGREIRRFRGHTGGVLSVAFSPDGRYVLTGSGGHDDSTGYYKAYDNTVRLWDVETGVELCRFNPGQRVTSVAFLPDGRFIVSGGGDGQPDLRLWELPEDLVSSGAEPAPKRDSEPEPSPPPQAPAQTSESSGADGPEKVGESQ